MWFRKQLEQRRIVTLETTETDNEEELTFAD
jgi:hypothetical protein